ncbi:hypothetical protein [Nostoc sp. ATCC 53789]|uniref:hypothetical protein n=1 Tax=Nostoc sp. ATCC 53789 TaxID=76335 RepID=UPI000DEC8C68|nr:hypothetical protein [Nostoc sp. ATCC 53789]MBD2510317.1 hypothetical protein [Desmonostoc muscorum FACHB-395]QHG17196.1 hypothetical protein GJB62_15255 [Nostoc sp. ATCC 53789]RCJ34986.1 hypothetical protein A6V25_33650 [Nostoc sp. ATCC 53789]
MSNMTQTGSLQLSSGNDSAKIGGDTSTFTTVSFPTPFPSGSTVIVIPMVQTFNGPDTPGIRIADVNLSGFKIRLNEVVGGLGTIADGKHTTETIGWAAYTV